MYLVGTSGCEVSKSSSPFSDLNSFFLIPRKNKMRTAIFGIFFCFFIADGSQGKGNFEKFRKIFEQSWNMFLVNKRGTLVSSLLHREYARLVRFWSFLTLKISVRNFNSRNSRIQSRWLPIAFHWNEVSVTHRWQIDLKHISKHFWVFWKTFSPKLLLGRYHVRHW